MDNKQVFTSLSGTKITWDTEDLKEPDYKRITPPVDGIFYFGCCQQFRHISKSEGALERCELCQSEFFVIG